MKENMEDKLWMPLDHGMREQTSFPKPSFPIQYYVDNLTQWDFCRVPLHCHPEHEFFSAIDQPIQVQIGREKFLLSCGETIFINGNQFHGYEQIEKREDCLCPNIVFSGELLAPVISDIYEKYLQPIFYNSALPCIIFTQKEEWEREVQESLFKVYRLLSKYGLEGYYKRNEDRIFLKEEIYSECFELEVLQEMLTIFKIIYRHKREYVYRDFQSGDQNVQMRLQQMIKFIQQHYQEKFLLTDLAAMANIGRSEADRCFRKYYGISPMEYVIQYRVKMAKLLLLSTELSIKEIGEKCGFRDSSYFIRKFRQYFSVTPSYFRKKIEK